MSLSTQTLNDDRIYKIIQLRESEEPTVNVPCVQSVDAAVKICLERAELITESYKQTEGEPWILRRAKALDHLLRKMTVYILDGEQIVGNYASTPDSLPTYPEFSYRWLEEGLDDEFVNTLDGEGKKRLKEINKYWADKNVEHELLKAVPEDLKHYLNWNGAITGPWFWPLGHMVPNYQERVFPLGLPGLLNEARDYRERLSKSDPEYMEKKDFYDAVEISAEAVIAWILRYVELAESKAATATDEKAKVDLLRVARVCGNIAANPPETFHEALQAFWFYHLLTTQITWCSVGLGQRFDRLFYPYYKKDKDAGGITYERAVELFEFLWIKLDDLGQINPTESCYIQVGGTKFQNVTIGGVDENGNDATNELSFAALDATMNIRTLQPALCLRYHDNIDPRLVDKAIDCISTGMGMPSIFNDNAAIKYMINLGINNLNSEKPDVHTEELLGLKKTKLIKTIGNYIVRAQKAASSVLPESVNKKIDDFLPDLPYKILTGGGKVGNSIRRTLKRLGIDLEERLEMPRNWASVACVGAGTPNGMVIQGTLTTIITAGVLNFLKCFEYVMCRGVEPTTGEQMGLKTPDPRTFKSYEEFLDAFLEQLKFQVKCSGKLFEIADKLYAEMTPRPFASLLMNTPVKRGKDATRAGDIADSEIFTMGPVNAADSLTAVKKLVFDEKSVTMDELMKACATDWEGYENLHRRCLEVGKFGNDDDYADGVLDDMYRKANKAVSSLNNHFGVPFRLEATLAGGYFIGGISTGATPDGRRRGETVSDGQLSPMHGRDMNGPTAVLKSCSKVDPTRSWNQLCNQKIQPQFLKGKNKKLFADYLKTWSKFNNWHIQFNCQNAEELREAQLHPEKHKNLVIRVAGYSAHFVDLTPGLQRDIIRRTEQDLNNFRSCST